MDVSKSARASWRDWLVSGVTPVPRDPPEAQALLTEAVRQGLVGLAAAAPDVMAEVPDSVRAEYGRIARALLARGVHQLHLGGGLLRRLEARGLRALPLKGAAVAEVLYDSPAERPMADVDLLVLDDVTSALSILEAEDFRLVERADHALALRHAPTGGIVELHRSVTSCPGFHPHDAEGVWDRREAGEGLVPWRPSAADLLVHLSLHAAFQHGFGLSLVQLLDFRRLLERLPLDPGRVLDVAVTARAEGSVLLALAAARAVVGAPPLPALEACLAARAPEPVRARARVIATGDPLALVAPERPSLLRARLELACGRRLALVRRTLWPAAWPDQPPRNPLLPLRRAARLIGRHTTLRRALATEPR